VIQIQSEYAKTSYAAFVAQAAKMGELHSNLAKAVFKPAELAIANMQGTKYRPARWVSAQSASRSNGLI
jgi:hypothetical protein